MKLVILAIGIPGSGKTTALSALSEKYKMRQVSRDEIRIEWFGHPHVQERKEEVRHEADARMRQGLEENVPVVLDSIFIDPTQRIRRIEEARKAGADRILGVIFTTPLEVAMERNRQRKYSVNDDVIEDMHKKLSNNPPTLEEGFDALYTSDELELLEERELEGRF
jgi:predicted kinase